MKTIFTNRNIKLNTKFSTMTGYVWSILLYGCECWMLMRDLERRLEAVKMWFIRGIIRVSWTERKTNEEVMEMARYKRSLLKIIRARQMKFFGHIIRANGMAKQLLCDKICGMKSRGRQHISGTQSELIHNQERIAQQRADQESWQQRGMEGHGRWCLAQIWHMKKEKEKRNLVHSPNWAVHDKWLKILFIPVTHIDRELCIRFKCCVSNRQICRQMTILQM